MLSSLNPLHLIDQVGSESSGCFGAELVVLQLETLLLGATKSLLGETSSSVQAHASLLSQLTRAFYDYSDEVKEHTWLYCTDLAAVQTESTEQLMKDGWILSRLEEGYLGLRLFKMRYVIDSCVESAAGLLKHSLLMCERDYEDRTAVIVVGGFAANRYLRSKVRAQVKDHVDLNNLHFITDYKKDTVARGAALFASNICPDAILRSALRSKFGFGDHRAELEPGRLAYDTVKLLEIFDSAEVSTMGTARWLDDSHNELRIPLCWSSAAKVYKHYQELSLDHPTQEQGHYDCLDPKNKIKYVAICGIQFGAARAETVRKRQAEGGFNSNLIDFNATLCLVDGQTLLVTMQFPFCGHWECSADCREHGKHGKDYMTAKFAISLPAELRLDQMELDLDDLKKANIIAPDRQYNDPHEHWVGDIELPHVQLGAMAISRNEDEDETMA